MVHEIGVSSWQNVGAMSLPSGRSIWRSAAIAPAKSGTR